MPPLKTHVARAAAGVQVAQHHDVKSAPPERTRHSACSLQEADLRLSVAAGDVQVDDGNAAMYRYQSATFIVQCTIVERSRVGFLGGPLSGVSAHAIEAAALSDVARPIRVPSIDMSSSGGGLLLQKRP